MRTVSKDTIAALNDETYHMLLDSMRPVCSRDPNDYRYNLTGVLNPDSTPYILPKSRDCDGDIVSILQYKQYTAYYPQSFPMLPGYFTENNIEPYFSVRSWDDYALGAITIEGMIRLNTNGIPWLLGDVDRADEIIRYVEIYRAQLSGVVEHSDRARQLESEINDFLREMRDGADRYRLRLAEENKNDGKKRALSLDLLFRRMKNNGNLPS